MIENNQKIYAHLKFLITNIDKNAQPIGSKVDLWIPAVKKASIATIIQLGLGFAINAITVRTILQANPLRMPLVA